ncbi:MAG: hypothetical protein HY683_08625 [Chloroflexi bacterium]|nr:hypothetical protein [Chloroflexota bacterium]
MDRSATRWTVCMPRYCIYAHACPYGALRQRSLEASRCFRFAHPERRPAPGLSPHALAVLERLRRQAQPSGRQSQVTGAAQPALG